MAQGQQGPEVRGGLPAQTSSGKAADVLHKCGASLGVSSGWKWWWDFSVILIYRISVRIVSSHLDLGMFEIVLHTITWAMPNVIWCESLLLNSVHFYKGLPMMYSIVSNKD